MKPVPRFTLTEVEWDVMVQAMRTELIEIAKQKRIVTYSELALLLPVYIHPGSYAFTRLLSQVCAEEEQAGHGLLCALVVSKATGIPGAGFFRGAAERGNYDASDPESYWRAEVDRVFARWDVE
ncbi:MAG TPA: hypothetical protein VHD90_27185 [Phototrophicaceae bacterium]|nr:hypothetical protein [Phototrophicaceae bacterium]